MKKIMVKAVILFCLLFLLFGKTVNAQSKEFRQKVILNNIKTANLIVEAQVIGKEQNRNR